MTAAKVRRSVQHWLRKSDRPWVLGHRGARRRAPENTIAAFDVALEEGADGVELDVRLDRAGEVVVIHDADLTRVTEGRDTRRIEQLTSAELETVELGGGARVPRLDDVLDWARRRQTRVNVELKRDVTRRSLFVWRVASLVRSEPQAAERLILSSFDPVLVAAVARLVPRVSCGWLVEGTRTVPGRSVLERLVGATAVHPQATMVTAESILAWRTARLPVNVWTVNEPDEARRLNGLGVDTIISDEPGLILRTLRNQ